MFKAFVQIIMDLFGQRKYASMGVCTAMLLAGGIVDWPGLTDLCGAYAILCFIAQC